MKKSVLISIESEKLSALDMYLGQKGLKLTDELDKCVDGLYQKNVPQNVRDFIDMKSATKTEKKPKKSAVYTSENHSEQ